MYMYLPKSEYKGAGQAGPRLLLFKNNNGRFPRVDIHFFAAFPSILIHAPVTFAFLCVHGEVKCRLVQVLLYTLSPASIRSQWRN